MREREREKVLKIFRISGHRDRERERVGMWATKKREKTEKYNRVRRESREYRVNFFYIIKVLLERESKRKKENKRETKRKT